MAYRLIESAQPRWRAISGACLFALVHAGAGFEEGILVEREPHARPTDEDAAPLHRSTTTTATAGRQTSSSGCPNKRPCSAFVAAGEVVLLGRRHVPRDRLSDRMLDQHTQSFAPRGEKTLKVIGP